MGKHGIRNWREVSSFEEKEWKDDCPFLSLAKRRKWKERERGKKRIGRFAFLMAIISRRKKRLLLLLLLLLEGIDTSFYVLSQTLLFFILIIFQTSLFPLFSCSLIFHDSRNSTFVTQFKLPFLSLLLLIVFTLLYMSWICLPVSGNKKWTEAEKENRTRGRKINCHAKLTNRRPEAVPGGYCPWLSTAAIPFGRVPMAPVDSVVGSPEWAASTLFRLVSRAKFRLTNPSIVSLYFMKHTYPAYQESRKRDSYLISN